MCGIQHKTKKKKTITQPKSLVESASRKRQSVRQATQSKSSSLFEYNSIQNSLYYLNTVYIGRVPTYSNEKILRHKIYRYIHHRKLKHVINCRV